MSYKSMKKNTAKSIAKESSERVSIVHSFFTMDSKKKILKSINKK